jgi:tetratricopeptide (TPR) repeat protein
MPLSYQDDTQPKPPDGLRDTSHLDDTGPRQATQPYYVAPPPQASEKSPETWMGTFLMVGAVIMASCLCVSIIGLSLAAGIRDEVDAISTESAGTRVARVETQYALAVVDFQEGRYELAEIRFHDVQTLVPDYRDIQSRLEQIQQVMSYTPIPSLTPTSAPPTATIAPDAPTSAPTQEIPPTTANAFDPADLYGRAETAMTLGEFEEAIRWLDALSLADPTYRRGEVQQKLLDAHIAQGRIYLRSQNEDGVDQLSRGVQLINRASELGTVPVELVYEADFVARYLAAQAYVEGGAFDQARQVLTRLCEENCDWTYRGVSVRDLLSQAGGIP